MATVSYKLGTWFYKTFNFIIAYFENKISHKSGSKLSNLQNGKHQPVVIYVITFSNMNITKEFLIYSVGL